MTAAIIIPGSILGIVGIGFSIWSIIDTRKRYYEDYMRKNVVPKIKRDRFMAITQVTLTNFPSVNV